MVVTLCHEINSPLMVVSWGTQALLERLSGEGVTPEDLIPTVRVMVQELERIEEVMERLRSLSEPVVSEYVGRVTMIDLERSTKKT